MPDEQLIPEAQLVQIKRQLTELQHSVGLLTTILDEKTLDSVESSIKTRQNQTPRIKGLFTSFRIWTTGVAATIIGFLQESGIEISDSQKNYLTIAVMAFAAVVIYSDTHRPIGK